MEDRGDLSFMGKTFLFVYSFVYCLVEKNSSMVMGKSNSVVQTFMRHRAYALSAIGLC